MNEIWVQISMEFVVFNIINFGRKKMEIKVQCENLLLYPPFDYLDYIDEAVFQRSFFI